MPPLYEEAAASLACADKAGKILESRTNMEGAGGDGGEMRTLSFYCFIGLCLFDLILDSIIIGKLIAAERPPGPQNGKSTLKERSSDPSVSDSGRCQKFHHRIRSFFRKEKNKKPCGHRNCLALITCVALQSWLVTRGAGYW